MDQRKKKLVSLLRCLCWAVMTALAFFMNYHDAFLNVSGYSSGLFRYAAGTVYKILCAIAGREQMISFAVVGFWLFYYHIREGKGFRGKLPWSWAFSAVFALAYVSGVVFLDQVVWDSSKIQILKMGLAWAGVTVFYDTLLHLLHHYLQKDIGPVAFGKGIFGRRPFAAAFVLMMIFWIIPLIVKFPAGLCYDVRFQIDQGLGFTELTTHHPILHTVVLSWFIRLGQWMGSANVGIFLFVAVEMVVFGLVVAYGFAFLTRIRAARWSRMAYLAFFALCPYVTGYIGAPIKDVYFSVFSLLFTVTAAQYVLEEDFWGNWKKPGMMILAAAGMVLSRNNGSYVLMLVVLAMLVFDRKKHPKRAMRLITLALVLIVPIGASKALEAVYQPESGSLVEALSLPLQQTARYVKEHGDEIPQEERDIINEVVAYDRLAEMYDPYISDPVKGLYQSPDTGELVAYIGVWLKQFLRAPGCYVAATAQQNILLLYPGFTNFTYYTGPDIAGYPCPYGNLFTAPAALEDVQEFSQIFATLVHKIPILYWLNNMAVYVLLMFALSYLLLCRKDWRNLLYMVPAYGAFVVVLLAPCVMMNARYTFPIIYAVPLYLGCYTAPGSKKK